MTKQPDHAYDGEASESLSMRNARAATAISELSGCRLDVARMLVRELGGVASALMASPAELAAHGMKPRQARRLIAASKLAREYRMFHERSRQTVGTAYDVWSVLRDRCLHLCEQESFYVVSMDIRNNLLGFNEVARGTVHGVEVHPREVFRVAMRQCASGIVLAHNHPSGDPTPSEQDVMLTRRLVGVGKLVGIPVIDHVIVSANGFRSLAETHGDECDFVGGKNG